MLLVSGPQARRLEIHASTAGSAILAVLRGCQNQFRRPRSGIDSYGTDVEISEISRPIHSLSSLCVSWYASLYIDLVFKSA